MAAVTDQAGGVHVADLSPLARSYEDRFPGTGIGEAHAEEREQRIRFKQSSSVNSLRRRNRTQGIRVPVNASCFDSEGRLKP